MFANKEAIATLVKCDATASRKEKDYVLALLESRPLVVSVAKAAFMLGVTSFAIYKAVRTGGLLGYYGLKGKRLIGIVLSSIEDGIGNSKRRIG